jgi:hypothetical protein
VPADDEHLADDEPSKLIQEGQPSGVVEIPVRWIRDDAV